MRIAAGICGVIIGLGAAGVLALSLWLGSEFPGGRITLPATVIKSDTAAISAGVGEFRQGLDSASTAPGAAVPDDGDSFSIRLSVASASEHPIFVGVAPTEQVQAYLAEVPRDSFREITQVDPVVIRYQRFVGDRPVLLPGETLAPMPGADAPDAPVAAPAAVAPITVMPTLIAASPPTGRAFWIDHVEGMKPRDFTWKLGAGAATQSLVLMNADGSPGVAVSVGVRFVMPYLATAIAIGTWGSAVALLLAVFLLFLAFRPRSSAPMLPPGSLAPPR